MLMMMEITAVVYHIYGFFLLILLLLILKYSGEQQSNQDHFLRLILSSQSTKKHDNHQVTIAVPDVGDNANGQLHHHLVGEKPRFCLYFGKGLINQ